jgi:hypothetical protein
MRTYTHRSARRNLAATKRSIVMFCAGIALILGTTSVGPSIFTKFGNNEILADDGNTTRPLGTTDLEAEAKKRMAAVVSDPKVLDTQTVAVPNKTPATTAPKSVALVKGIDNTAGSAAASVVIETITPSTPAEPTEPTTTPTEPEGGENGNTGTEPENPGGGTGGNTGGSETPTDPDEPTGGELGGGVEVEPEAPAGT